MENLGDFFSAIGNEKKRKKQKVEEDLQRKEAQLEELKKDAKIFEGLFFAPEEDTLEEVLDNPQWKRFFKTEPPKVKTDNWREDYKPTEIESVDIIKPEPLKPSPGAERFDMNESVKSGLASLDLLKQKEHWITENQEAQDTVQEQINLLRMQLAQTQAKVEVQGGGGAVWLWDLDDVNVGSPGPTGYPPIADGTLLIWDSEEYRWVGIASTAINSEADTTLDHVLKAGNISGMGMSVGFVTATGASFANNVTIGGTLQAASSLILGDVVIQGNVDIAGTVTKEDVTEIDSIGIITAREGIISLGIVTSVGFDGPLEGDVLAGVVTTGQLQVTGLATVNNLYVSGVSTFVGVTTHDGAINFTSNVGDYIKGTSGSNIRISANGVINAISLHGSTSLRSDGDLHVAGLTTTKNLLVTGIATFGTTSVVIDGDNDLINVGSGLTLSGVDGVITPSLVVSGVVTATSFVGDGSNLTNIISGVGIQSGGTIVGTGFTDINFAGTGISSVVGSGTTVTINIPATSITRQVETATTTTSSFTITDGYSVGLIDVYLNGVKLRNGTDFTATNGTSVTMTPAVVNGDVVEFQIYENLRVGDDTTTLTGTQGQLLQHNGSSYVGVSSVGFATFFNDHHQGYYRYTTDYYTTGVANTVQTLPADTFVLVQPQVRTNKTKYMPKKMLNVNNNDPWVGTGATIGTGQTEFSLAGLDEGSSVIVRIASQFNPDVDNTNIDFALNFTTNPTTQSFGTTHFSVTREQALVCNEGAEQPYISETLINFYVGSSLSGLTTQTAGTFNVSARASDEGEFEMMALTINVVT